MATNILPSITGELRIDCGADWFIDYTWSLDEGGTVTPIDITRYSIRARLYDESGRQVGDELADGSGITKASNSMAFEVRMTGAATGLIPLNGERTKKLTLDIDLTNDGEDDAITGYKTGGVARAVIANIVAYRKGAGA